MHSNKLLKKAFKKQLRKALIKVSSKLLGGWISIGIFAFDFSKCMGWLRVGSVDTNPVIDCNELVRVTIKRNLLDLKNNTSLKYIFISKKAIGYISDTNHELKETYKDLKIYEIESSLNDNRTIECKAIETRYYTQRNSLITSSVTSDFLLY